MRPFVLLDDVPQGQATLFRVPLETVTAMAAREVRPALARLREPGDWAGFMGFEAGLALEPRLCPRAAPPGEPLMWFARFAVREPVVADRWLAEQARGEARLGAAEPVMDAHAHAEAVARVQALIAAGDIYQANLTFAARVPVAGCPLALYRRLRAVARPPHGALLFTGALWLLSLSPELFFTLEGRALTARPMKGTAARGPTAALDDARAEALGADPKNRAENLMITDLIRNDLSRVARDVRVPALFAVERYPTVLQMTSTVTATARPGTSAADVLERMFPCGSVTGAPKIRAQQVIAEVEPAPRGAYTGAIGAITMEGDARFNVAIRTLVWPQGATMARLGLGSGVVADSKPADEWRECLAKAAFLARAPLPDLIETMRVMAGQLPDLDLHLARLGRSAAFLGHSFDAAALRAAVMAAGAGHDGRLRLLLAPSGAHAIHCSPAPPAPAGPVSVTLVPLPVAADDWRLCHKTSDRGFYDAARRASGSFEVLFVDDAGFVTEGSFTSLFVADGERLLTPPLARGLLPGVLRARLLAEGRAVEADIRARDLATARFFIGNALRGLMAARLAS